MKHKTSELTGGQLNAAVAKALCVGDPVAAAKYSHPVVIRSLDICILGYGMSDAAREKWADFQLLPSDEPLKTHPVWDLFFRERQFSPSTSWETAGPIIERERISIVEDQSEPGMWMAGIKFWIEGGFDGGYHSGPTPLIAAMRAFCCAKLGEEVDL